MDNQRSELSNKLAMARIGAVLVLPYWGYWFSRYFADGIAHEIYWNLAVSILIAIASVLSSMSNFILAVKLDMRIDTSLKILLCLLGLAYGVYNFTITLNTIVPPHEELFDFAVICFFAVNGLILSFSLVNSFMVKGNLVANDSTY
jgi:hypothetical protein